MPDEVILHDTHQCINTFRSIILTKKDNPIVRFFLGGDENVALKDKGPMLSKSLSRGLWHGADFLWQVAAR